MEFSGIDFAQNLTLLRKLDHLERARICRLKVEHPRVGSMLVRLALADCRIEIHEYASMEKSLSCKLIPAISKGFVIGVIAGRHEEIYVVRDNSVRLKLV